MYVKTVEVFSCLTGASPTEVRSDDALDQQGPRQSCMLSNPNGT